MNFKSSEQLIARVSKKLKSYKSAGLLDEGDFYRWIKEILATLNVPSFSPVHTIIELTNNVGKVAIPNDMYMLWAVWKYDQLPTHTENEVHYQRQERYLTFQDTKACEEDKCVIQKEGDIIVNKYYVATSNQTYTTRYNKNKPIKIVNYTLDKCLKGSPSLTVGGDVLRASMDNKYMYFNFNEGAIYLQYFSLMLDEFGLPMVPDVVEIERTIEDYITYLFFQELYYNGTVDALQRMQVAQAAYLKSYAEAKHYVKIPTFKDIISMAEKNRGKYRIFELQTPNR